MKLFTSTFAALALFVAAANGLDLVTQIEVSLQSQASQVGEVSPYNAEQVQQNDASQADQDDTNQADQEQQNNANQANQADQAQQNDASQTNQADQAQQNDASQANQADQAQQDDTCTLTGTYVEGTNVTHCSSIVIDSLSVPAGVMLDLTNVTDGTSIKFQGTTTFGQKKWAGPLIKLKGKTSQSLAPCTNKTVPYPYRARSIADLSALHTCMSRLRAFAALATAATALLTVLIAFAICRANGVYVGGLAWPFVSDLGRDPPGSYVLFYGLNIVAVLLGLTWSFNHEYKQRVLQQSLANGHVSTLVCSLSYVGCLFGVVGAFGLPVFASFSASPTLHNNAAFGFLLCETVAMFTNTYLNYRIFLAKRSEMDAGVFITDRYGPRSVSRIKLGELQAVKRGFLIELSCVALYTMCVLVYLPVLYNSSEAPHLTIAQCVALKLGENYCSSTMRLDDVYTKLWDYEKDIAVHQVRALAQLGCMLTLIGYTLSFFADNKEEEAMKDRDRAEAAIVYYQQSASMPPKHSPRRKSTRRSQSTSSSVSEPCKHSNPP
ncbi:hypothetical protein PF007_g16371 [Phytophthora fragariae]|uniref:CWH43-like N-terminal domain-containing protein n=1 Tax=Phytophthora fragariae TaxID=53985 RepID=A0A6A3TA29_9STRA|nr:hypothetical protein PF007_g16371 [Phytophthora fragariae]KAE9132826.1 hypothetical protein PF006_g15184 [Phytophthora fragariae]